MAKEKSSPGEAAPLKSKQSTGRKTASQSRLKVVSDSASATSGRAVQSAELAKAELDQEIRLRAYLFYCERGGEHGAHEDDWHRAEQEVREKYRGKFNYGT